MSHYTVHAANRIFDYLQQEGSISFPDLSMAMALACRTLKRLDHDLSPGESLTRGIETLKGRLAEVPDARSGIEQLADEFIHIELDALIDAGINKGLASYLLSDSNRVREAIQRPQLDPEELQMRIRRLRETTCSLSKILSEALSSRNRDRKIKERIRQALYGIGGGAIIATNASTDAITTLGMAPWATAISGSFGGTLLGVSVGPTGFSSE